MRNVSLTVNEVPYELELDPRVVQLAVRGLPGSGTPDELINAAGIGTAAIVDAARRLAGKG